MNLLEHYIEDILSEEEFTIDDKWEIPLNLVRVKMVVNCHGYVEEVTRVFNVNAWESIKREGYYMA